tara:strand:- start:3111 stop:5339 length:2229 start_codon:yes stop_codon:yes gene_type:complete
MINKISILFILFLSYLPLKAEIIKDIVIEGNNRFSDETIKIYGDVEINKDINETDIDKILNNLYTTDFFEDIKINLSKNVLTIKLKEYPLINNLVIIGEDSNKYKDAIKDAISLKEKKAFIKTNLIKDVERIKSLYSSIGFNSSKVEAKVKKIDDNNYDLLIEINRGDKTKITKINFIGNKNIKSNRLREIIASEEHKFWKIISRNSNFNENQINLDVRLLTNYYKSVGFYDVKINSNFAQIDETGGIKLVYSIDEGIRFTINKISMNIDKVFDKEIFFPLNKVFKKYIGDYYSPFYVKRILEELDETIDNNNLQFVEHNVQEIIELNKINIVLNIFEGEKVLVERINILGNNITNESVIRGELLIDEGDPFTNLNLEKSISEIKSRNIFRNVNYEISNGSQPNLKIIDISVEEKPTGEISAGAGIGTDGGSFAINIQENNWLGEGKSLGFALQLDSETVSGGLNFTDPNYDFLGNSISYSLSSEQNDKPNQGYENSVISAGVSTRFEQYKDIFTSIGLNATNDDLRTDGSASDALKKQKGTFNEINLNYGVSLDKRNRSFKPTSGSIISFGQEIPVYADKSFYSSYFSSSSYNTFNENFIGAGKVYLANITALESDVRISKRKGLSSRRLRGFKKGKVGPIDGLDHVGGNNVAAVNFEANLPNFFPEDTNTDATFFLDFANIWGVDYDSSIDDSNKIRSSTGFIASWNSPLGPMSFVFSQNISKASTDETETFNFNLGTTF